MELGEFKKLPEDEKMEIISTECDRANLAVSAMPQEERDKLAKVAKKIMFPNDSWVCPADKVHVSKGVTCKFCNRTERSYFFEAQSNDKITQYVVGFMFSHSFSRVALIRKNKPAWQAGKLNGIGGHVEESDGSSERAMAREFLEETGKQTHFADWLPFAWMGDGARDSICLTWEIDFFAMMGDVDALKTVTKEEVIVMDVSTAYPGNVRLLDNLPFLISLAVNHLRNGRPKFTTIEYPAE